MSFNLGKPDDKPKSSGKRAPAVDAGAYPARLVQLIDVGIQPQRAFKGEEKPPVHQGRFTYELNDEFMKDEDGNELEDKPRWVSEQIPLYPLSSDRATSTHRYKALDPEIKHAGDFTQLIGDPVNITLTKNQRDKDDPGINYIAGTTPVRAKDADKMEPLKNQSVIFSLEGDDVETFKSFPQWLQDLITSGIDFEKTNFAKALASNKPEQKEENDAKEDSSTEEDW